MVNLTALVTRGTIAAVASTLCVAPAAGQMVEWRQVGADQGASKYSSAGDIDRSHVSELEIAWTWEPNELPNREFNTRPGSFEATPLMIDGVLYLSTMYTRVVALNAATGEQLWAFDPEAYRTCLLYTSPSPRD